MKGSALLSGGNGRRAKIRSTVDSSVMIVTGRRSIETHSLAITIDNDLTEGLRHIEGSLLYLADAAEGPVTTGLPEPSNGAAGWPGHSRRYTMPICDGRPINKKLSLDRHGFVLVRHQSAVANFYDEQKVRAVYYPEVEWLGTEA